MLPHFSHFSTDPVPMWLSYTARAGMNFTREAGARNLIPQKRGVSLGSWLTSPASRFPLVIASSTFSFCFLPCETSKPSAEYWFLWCVKSGWSWMLEQAKVVSKAEPCPQPWLCSQINFCRVSNKTNQTNTVSGFGGTELWETPDFSFSCVPY